MMRDEVMRCDPIRMHMSCCMPYTLPRKESDTGESSGPRELRWSRGELAIVAMSRPKHVIPLQAEGMVGG